MNATDAAAPPATLPAATADPAIRAEEAAHFDRLAADWWDPAGGSAMLHRLNPVRLGFVRAQADGHWRLDPRARRPFAGRTALDIGCGAGLLAEPLARLGAAVTGVDAAPQNIAVARAHAAAQRLAVDYREGSLRVVAGERFDLVTAMEVVEHVADPAAFVAGLAAALAPGGLLILSTPARTAWSRLALVGIGEGLGLIPRGTHDWDRFLAPDTLAAMAAAAGLTVTATRGVAFAPGRGFRLADDLSLDYLMAARW